MSSSHEKEIRLEQIIDLMREELARGKKVTFGPKGVSMRPLLRQRIDSIEIAPLPEGKLKKYDLPLYQRPDGAFILHRIVKVGEDYTCIGDNQYIYEEGVQHDWLIGVASGMYRGEKYIPFTNWKYRLYTHLWCGSRPVRWFCIRVRHKLKRIFKK